MSEQPLAQAFGHEVEALDPQIIDATFDGIMLRTFGSQIMKTYEGSEDLPVMSGGPTWTGSGKIQDADDGDTGGGGPSD